MGRFVDLSGSRFGRLVVNGLDDSSRGSKNLNWFCSCDCGQDVLISASHLRTGHTQSCGCLRSEVAAKTRAIRFS